MIEFFEWIGGLPLLDGMLYFLLIAVVLAIIPYYQIITKYLKHFVYKKEVKINFFELRTITEHFVGIDEQNNPIYIRTNSEEVFIHNTKAILFWNIEGAKRVNLLPVQENIKGNSAEILLDFNVLQYTIEAEGFDGEKVTAEINLSKENFYSIETAAISRSQIRPLPAIHSHQYTKNKKLSLRSYKKTNLPTINTKSIQLNNIISTNSKKLEILICNDNLRSHYKKIASSSIMKSYTFSTAKYQNLP